MALTSPTEITKNTGHSPNRSAALAAIDAGLLVCEDAETLVQRFNALVRNDTALTAFSELKDAKFPYLGATVAWR